jgi:hypothetical protein
MPVILATWEAEIRKIAVQSQPRQIVHKTLPLKYTTRNRAGGVAEVVEHLPSKCEALNSNPSTAKNKQTNKQKPTMRCHFTSLGWLYSERQKIHVGEDLWREWNCIYCEMQYKMQLF